MKNVMKLCLIFVFSLASCEQNSEISEIDAFNENESLEALEKRGGATNTTSDVFKMGDSNVIYGSSKLVRNKNGISVVFKTSNLIPGNAYTLWAVAVNIPELCDAVPCRVNEIVGPARKPVEADALLLKGLVANSEKMTFAGHIKENDGSTSVNPDMGLPTDVGGLWDAQTAEIHLVIRDHGVAIPGLIDEQTSTFTGGCVENTCGLTQASIHSAE